METPAGSVAQVALPVALATPLTYSIPASLEGQVAPGHRVKVPLRGRSAFGFVLAVQAASELPPAAAGMNLREITGLDPEEVVLTPDLLELTRWIATYYLAPIGQAIEAAVPRSIARPPRQGKTKESAQEGLGTGPDPRAQRLDLTKDQAQAVARIESSLTARDGHTYLLHGVTASGKTEVYLRATETALANGQGVLFLVPEIALGTQIMDRIRERFGERAAEYHSQLKPSIRRKTWWDARRGHVRFVVGARSAVFLPVEDLGLIIIDEEHEPSYKQSETPRYQGRDTALMRARIAGAVTIMGSATPSLESFSNARRGKYTRLDLPERIDARPAPVVTLVDLRSRGNVPLESPDGIAVRGGGDHAARDPLSGYLLERLRAVLSAGDQAILFLNRRGFATSVQCHDCGFVFDCPHCNVVLTHHSSEDCLRCHYCNHTLAVVASCPDCKGNRFDFRGVGTQRVEAAIKEHLPEARFLRMDLDSTRKRGELTRIIRSFEAGEADILLGTQMVAKGFDFPRVTLVGVINADREMGIPDFRGQERAFQLLTQVAGRAGRRDKTGEVIFQTYMPDHHVILAAARQDYESFWQQEMSEREPLGYPPVSRLANLLFDGPDESAVIRRASAEADLLRTESGLTLLGPAPMPLSRLKGQFRWHVTLLGPQVRRITEVLHGVVGRAREAGSRGVRVQVDMDPASML